MFRSKAEVDRHASDILHKIHNENEKKLRGFTFARLYNQVKDFETAKKYLCGFLSIRDHHAPSHKLMAQLNEATGNLEKSLQCYKRSLEIDGNQRDIVLKICELYCKISVDHETARYWADRADQLFPHHETVFKLRECIMSGEGEPNRQELEKLITAELAAQPYNLTLRTKLLHLYLDTERVKEAYVHATKVEKKKPFPNSKEWYYMLVDVFEAYQNEAGQELDSHFYIMFLTALDHLVRLTLAEPHALSEKTSSLISTNVDDAAAVLLQFDQNLKAAANKDMIHGAWLYFLHHMKGQLYFHLGTLLLKRVKKDQGNWKEACRIGIALFLIGYSFKPANLLQEIWFSQMEEQQQLFAKFFQQGSLRTSFIGHTVIALCKEDKHKLLQKLKHDICLPQVQERTFHRLFSSAQQKLNSSESYFLNDTTFVNSNLEFPTLSTLQEYDSAAFKLCPHSLHHLVWLQLHKEKSKDETCRNSLFEAFKGLQYSNSNLSKGNPESLCLLDLEAFLFATLYTTSLLLEQKSAVMNNKSRDTALSVPPDIAERLCCPEQAEWWKAAYGLVNSSVKIKLGEQRRTLQHGLEVIRGIGNHGMEIQLVVHLAQAFADQASALSTDNSDVKNANEKISSSKVSALESRSVHYWSIVLNMLDKLEANKTLSTPKDHLFVGISSALSKEEIFALREEGKLYLACRFMNSGKLESAVEILEKLSSPYASYYLALTYKKLALQESTTEVTKTALLNKARDALYVTMDRIKSDNTHSLNRDLYIEIEDVENEIGNNRSYGNANDTLETEDGDEYDSVESSFRLNSKNSTPISSKQNRITHHSTPRPSTSFMSARTQYPNSVGRAHVEPSPERLDAQIRSLTLTQSTVISTMLEQQRSLLETNKAIVEQLKTNNDVVLQLKKKLDELQFSNSKPYRQTHKSKSRTPGGQGDEEGSGEEEEEYDPNGYLDYYVDENVEDYRQTGYSYAGRAVAESVGSTMGYVPPPALPPTHYAYQYPPPPPPHPALCPPGAIPADTQHYYHTPLNHGLPFSEGQQLPQFKFHVASPVVKPAVMNVGSVPQPVMHNIMPQQPPIPVVPPQASQPSWAKPPLVPHAFQIPLPADLTTLPPPPPPPASQIVTMPTSLTTVAPSVLTTTPTSSHVRNASSDSPILLTALLQNAHPSTITPVTSTEGFSFKGPAATSSPDTPNLYRSRKDSEAYSDTDIEKEVMVDFKPVIPLPAEIVVETGEESETALFEDRAKLFRFVDHEWKERGVGVMKILRHNDTEIIRLLMRRDQVHKICANHRILPDMIINYLKDSNKILTWIAQDFSDEKVKLEQFCMRFKTSDIALTFKKVFEDSVAIAKLKESSDSKVGDIAPIINGIIDEAVELTKPSFSAEFLPKPGSWFCSTCCLNNAATKMVCAACETPKPGIPKSPGTAKSAFALPSSLPVISPAPSSTVSDTLNNKTISFPTPIIAKSESSKPTAPQSTNFSDNQKSLFGNLSFSGSNIFSKPSNDGNQNVSKANFQSPDSKYIFGNVTTPTSKLGDAIKSGASTIPFGGFTFSTAPVFVEKTEEPQDREILVVTTKCKEGPQVIKVDSTKTSPFAGFSFNAGFGKPSPVKSEPFFKPSTDVNSATFSTMPNSISSPEKDLSSKSFSNAIGSPFTVTVTKDGRRVSTDNTEPSPEEFVPTAEFQPVVSLPALVDAKTGEEGEQKLFGERAKLFRYDNDTKEWKERGIGELKILYSQNDGKYRVLMRRDQVLKLCANHYILPEMKLSPLPSNDKSWIWHAQDFSDLDLRPEQFAARFKTKQIAQEFQKVFEKCRQLVEDKKSISVDDSQNDSKEVNPCLGNKDSFGDMFKPDPKSWECTTCYIRNVDTDCCLACNSQKPGLKPPTKKDVDFWECLTCRMKNDDSKSVCTSCNTDRKSSEKLTKDAKDSLKPFSELFKPDPSSWACDACYVRNDGNQGSCVACQTPRPGAAPAKDSVSTNKSTASTFKFGVPVSSSETKSIFGSDASKTNSSGFIFGTKTDSNSSPTFKFGATSIAPSTGFIPDFSVPKTTEAKPVFGGMPFTSTTPASTTSSSSFNSSFFQKHPSVAIPPVTTAPTFVFGKPSNSDSQSTTVPSNQQQNQSAMSFNFSSSKEPDSNKEETDDPYEFQFGSPQKYEFNFSGVRPRSPSKSLKSPKSPGSPSEDEDEVEPSDADNIYFQPVIPLPPKVEVKTGEEDETTLFTNRAKLFRFMESEWKERGIGDVKILHNVLQKKIRLVMRRDKVLKLCLNHQLNKDMEFSWKSENSLSWSAVDFSEGEGSPELFAIRFKTPELAQQFHKTANAAKELLTQEGDAITPSSASTKVEKPAAIGTESFAQKLSSFSFTLYNDSPKSPSSTFDLSSRFGTSPGKVSSFSDASVIPAVDFKASFSSLEKDPDVDVTYEAKATPEQVAAALKLQLPPNFYTYENKAPCPGCRGCDDGVAVTFQSNTPDEKEIKEEPKDVQKVDSTRLVAKLEPLSLFSNTSLSTFSFAELVNEKAEFGQLSTAPASGAMFPGAGQRLFANASAQDENEDGEVAENPDIHFEPVIPLPSLVDAKTGEEDEIPIFCYRAKLYRYDASSGQWKERGTGDMKILQHREKCRFRLLHRRELVLKIACNHLISEELDLMKMSTSNNSMCWVAIDYSEGKPESSQFAVKFKNENILREFESKFNECKARLATFKNANDGDLNAGKDSVVPEQKAEIAVIKETANEPPGDASAPVLTLDQALASAGVVAEAAIKDLGIYEYYPDEALGAVGVTVDPAFEGLQDYQQYTDEDEEEEEEEDDDEDEDIIFDKRVTFEVLHDATKQYESVGTGSLQVLYDDTVYGYRVQFTSDSGEKRSDHIIAIQTCLRTTNNFGFWAAIDISVDPPKRRQFRVTFSSKQALIDFERVFEEGKQAAVEAEIVEKCDNFLPAPIAN